MIDGLGDGELYALDPAVERTDHQVSPIVASGLNVATNREVAQGRSEFSPPRLL